MQALSRRDLLKAGAGLAAATLPFAHIGTAAALARGATTAPFGRSRFTPLVGGLMQMSDGSRSVQVRLSAVRDLRPARMPGDEQCFSILFEASPSTGWPQGTYRFSSPKLGAVSLFGVPTSAGGRRYYTVVVNSPS